MPRLNALSFSRLHTCSCQIRLRQEFETSLSLCSSVLLNVCSRTTFRFAQFGYGLRTWHELNAPAFVLRTPMPSLCSTCAVALRFALLGNTGLRMLSHCSCGYLGSIWLNRQIASIILRRRRSA